MAIVSLPADLDRFAEIDDPQERDAIEKKLRRYIARGEWARQALAHLKSSPPPQPRTPTSLLKDDKP